MGQSNPCCDQDGSGSWVIKVPWRRRATPPWHANGNLTLWCRGRCARRLPFRIEAREQCPRVVGRQGTSPQKPLSYVTSASGEKCCLVNRSEEHTSELQSLTNLVCRL